MKKHKQRNRVVESKSAPAPNNHSAGPDQRESHPADSMNWYALPAFIAILLLWSYWPTFSNLLERWYHVPDYSHGFLVIPAAILFLWVRRGSCPLLSKDGQWIGVAVVLLALSFRVFGARTFLPAFDAWSIILWVAGISLWLGGRRFFVWCLPAILFLFFMVPLPYRAEHFLNAPLRSVSASSGCFLLQSLGQPAVQEGTVIVLDDEEFEVAKECSGLRMLMGVCALAFAYVVLSRGPFWQKVLILLSALPVAVLANVLRVTMTALFFPFHRERVCPHVPARRRRLVDVRHRGWTLLARVVVSWPDVH